MKVFVHDKTGISIKYPDEWAAEEREEIVSVFSIASGSGALQFSFYQAADTGEQALRRMMVDFLTPPHSEIVVESIHGRLHVSLIDKDDTFWRYWLFAIGEVVVFATYNCEVSDRDNEDAIISAILQSMEICKER